MGVTPQQDIDDWDAQQRQEYAQKANYTVIKLPCCGSAVEAKPEDGDQYVTCPNRFCGKRHSIAWGHRPKIQTERPPLTL